MKNKKNKDLKECKYCESKLLKTKLTFLGFRKGVCQECKKTNIYLSSEAYFILLILIFFGYKQFPTFWSELDTSNFAYGIFGVLLQNLFVLANLIFIPLFLYFLLKTKTNNSK